jgi:peptidoglycan/LPS O-acetylase OafA/YrhL
MLKRSDSADAARARANANYRPDIDGLRAIAVLSVVFYHAGFKVFSGGFVGVDVFFVISGFLITRLMVGELARGRFTFASFYVRRARRIFPAFFFTMVISFAAAFVLMPPEHMRKFAGSLIYAALSLANIYFYRESGYFDTEAVFKPLLHTWSLSVEEQFYLFWPLLLVLLSARKSKWDAPAVMTILGVISLIWAERSMTKQSAAFYFPQFRVVEFAVGAIMVWLADFTPPSKAVLEIVLLAGLALIAYPIFMFDTHTAFPGVHALVPCLGAALAIFAGRARFAGTLLNNPISVWLGLISYSLYLIHWPLIVFYKYYRIDELNLLEQCALVFAAVAAAALMYVFVETPFRRPAKPVSPAAFGLVCAMCTLAIALPAADAWGNGGWRWRFPVAFGLPLEAAADRSARLPDPSVVRTGDPAVPPVKNSMPAPPEGLSVQGAAPLPNSRKPRAPSIAALPTALTPQAGSPAVVRVKPELAKPADISRTIQAQLAAVDSDEYANFRSRYIWRNMSKLQEPFTSAPTRKVLVIGDSQAGDFVNVLREKQLDDGIELKTLVVVTECQAIIPLSDEVYRNIDDTFKERCRKEHETLRTSHQVEVADVVVLCALWQEWAVPHLPNTLEKLAERGAKEIYIVGRKAQGMTAQMFVTRSGGTANVEKFAARYRDGASWNINSRIRHIKDVRYIDLMLIACPSDDSCPVFTPEGEIIFYDTTHLTPAGARYFGERLLGSNSLQFLAVRAK